MANKIDTEKLEKDGYAIINDFLTAEEVDELKSACWEMVDNMDPTKDGVSFVCGNEQKSKKYFMESGDKIGFFYEPKALGETGQFLVEKRHAFNKIGHALHILSPAFRKCTFSDKVKQVMQEIGYIDPVALQSMCIFKSPFIGAEVPPHQDMTFLCIDTGKLVAVWIALEDVDIENSCLQFVPGSHKGGLVNNRRMLLDHQGTPESATKMVGADLDKRDYSFVQEPVKKGSLVVFDGSVIHRSEANLSDRSRLVYTFHVFDSHDGIYSPDNWLQPTEAGSFAHMYTTSPQMP